MRTVMTLFGTRPEIIRLSEFFKEVERRGFRHVMVNTGQNYSKSLNAAFFAELGIRDADYHFGIEEPSIGKQIGQVIARTEEVVLKEKPELLFVLGDTNSGLGALAAAHHGVKVAHWEAGMRSFNWEMPEEKNRHVIDGLSDFLFPYTEDARRNLLLEGFKPNSIFVTGNPIVDVLEKWRKRIAGSRALAQHKLKEKGYFLATVHRVENVDRKGRFAEILRGFGLVAKRYGKPVLYPIHPRAKDKMAKFGLKAPEGVRLVEPLGFFDFAQLERHASCLLTDSGTVQEEGVYFRVPCVSVRKATERPETVECGSNIVSGIDAENIAACVGAALETKPTWAYSLGDGRASVKVANVIRGNLDLPVY